MKFCFQEEIFGIYRLKVPFYSIYTSVFFIKTDAKTFLVDCATTAFDVDTYIVPALGELGYNLSDVNAIVLTHHHADHAGGIQRILQLAPQIKIVTNLCMLDQGVSTYALAGHTKDMIGVLDERSKTLISGDGLQGAGVDKWRCYTEDSKAYLETLENIKNDTRIENILFSHEYEPWYQNAMIGRNSVLECLTQCAKYVKL